MTKQHRNKLIMNLRTISRSTAVMLISAIWLGSSLSAYAFYHPSTGRWLSRDPIGERGGANSYAFVGNTLTIDPFGLAEYIYQEAATPSGDWLIRMSDIDFENSGTTRHGFRSQFLPVFDSSKCPCKTENIVMVQALHNSIMGYVMDNAAAYAQYHHVHNTPIPDYYLLKAAWVLKLRENSFQIVDSPLRKGTENDDYTWQLEDCAVCRHTLRDGTVVDQVQGCVRFDFVRHIDGTAELVPGKVVHARSQPPSALWEKARKNWTKWTNE